MTNRRQQGRVKFFDLRRGYGFIIPDDGGPDVFVHHGALVRAGLPTLLPGQRLSYELRPAPRGKRPQAECLLLLPDGPEMGEEEGLSAASMPDDGHREAAE